MNVLRCLGKVLMVLALSAATARAEPSKWLSWVAPPECPTAQDIEQRVVGLLGNTVAENLGLRAQTALHWTGGRWEVSVDLLVGGHPGRRQVAVSSCADAADFVAVAVALAVDPSLSEPVPVAPVAPTKAEEQPDEVAPAVTDMLAQARSGLRPSAAQRHATLSRLSTALSVPPASPEPFSQQRTGSSLRQISGNVARQFSQAALVGGIVSGVVVGRARILV